MALVRENIDNARDKLLNVSQKVRALDDYFSRVKVVIEDENYQIFVQGTDYGKEVHERLLKLIDLAQNISNNQIADINLKYSQFLDNQENLNNGTM